MEFVLRAFLNGADGVFIGACRLNECNYITHGNYHALNMVLLCRRILERAGLNPERLRIEFMSSGDGILFARAISDFVDSVKEMGPLGEGEGVSRDELRSRLEEAIRLVPYIKMAKREKLEKRLESRDEWEGYFTKEETDELFEKAASYYIEPDECRACMVCLSRCPVGAIAGGKKRIHVIDQEKCIRCGTCLEVCRFDAVRRISGGPVPPPLPEEERAVRGKGGKE